MSRLEKLQRLVATAPDDPLGHYALGLEFIQLGRWAEAIAAFDRTLAADARYAAAYYHKARAELRAGQSAGAAATLRSGIAAAQAAGDVKTVKEMQQLLEAIP